MADNVRKRLIDGLNEDLQGEFQAIITLGGIPASTPAPVNVVSDAKAMVEAALQAELETIKRYVKRRKQAEQAGEPGLAVEFDTLLSDESNHRDELRQMLARWP